MEDLQDGVGPIRPAAVAPISANLFAKKAKKNNKDRSVSKFRDSSMVLLKRVLGKGKGKQMRKKESKKNLALSWKKFEFRTSIEMGTTLVGNADVNASEQEIVKMPKLIVHPHTTWRIAWDWLILLLIFFITV